MLGIEGGEVAAVGVEGDVAHGSRASLAVLQEKLIRA